MQEKSYRTHEKIVREAFTAVVKVLAIKIDDYEQDDFHDHEGLLAATNMSLNV